MPSCARPDPGASFYRRKARLAVLLAIALVAACTDGQEGGPFDVSGVVAHWSNGRLDGRCELELKLAPAAREALLNGVSLTILLELILRNTGDQTRVATTTQRYGIRYLPLSEHYQLSGPEEGRVANFPRLRHALAQLDRPEFSLQTGALPTGDYELLVRVELDPHSLPPPMRLPALFDAGWKHDSGWTSWPLRIASDG